MKKLTALLALICICISSSAVEREYLWTKKNMPHSSDSQIAEMTNVSEAEGFKASKHRIPFIEWYDAPADSLRNGTCMILISGGAYKKCCDVKYVDMWQKTLTACGVQCVNFVYRTPRPEGLPIYQTAWEDGQRAVRMVRSEAAKRGFDPDRIGVVGMSAGSHLGLLLATNACTRAYAPVDKLDSVACNINIAILHAPAYVTSDGESGKPASREGYGPDVKLSGVFSFDSLTPPISFHHGGLDPYSPNGSTLAYRQLRRMGIPAELHLYPGKKHGAYGFERGVEFMRQMGFLGELGEVVKLMKRFPQDVPGVTRIRQDVWPEGRTPDFQEHQCKPYLEWYIPDTLKTTAIQIIYSGGSYEKNSVENNMEVNPAVRYLNARGMTVVTLRYRTPRPLPESGLSKHTTAWQDLQRTIRIVRSQAAGRGLDPDRIGIMGSSAGGHLTLMGVTSSLHSAYARIDEIDKLSCSVQWGIGIYPAYALTDGADWHNTTGGNDDSAVLVPEFSFDLRTAPMLLIHGDADYWASMNSVKVWEKMRAMGVQSELHTLALQKHCFQNKACPGTGAYNWLDRVWDFLQSFAFPVK